MLHKEYEYELPPMKSSRRAQAVKQEPMASDDSRLSEDSNAEVPLDCGMMLLLEACEKLAEESCTAETLPAAPRRATSSRRRVTIDYATGCSTTTTTITETKSQPQKTGTKRRSRTELHGPCCHCGATESPQWRKGPMCKPVLCNACGTRFLRTRSLGKVVIGRNGRRYAKEEPPAAVAAAAAEEHTCENSTGSTDDVHHPHAAPVRRDSRLGLSRPTKTRRRLDDPPPSSTPSRTTSPTKPTSRQRTSPAPRPYPTLNLPSASSATSPPPRPRTAALAPHPAAPAPHHPAAASYLLQQLLAPAHLQHPTSPFLLPPAPHLDVGYGPTPPFPTPPTTFPQQQHLGTLHKPRSSLQQPDHPHVYLHVQAGPLS